MYMCCACRSVGALGGQRHRIPWSWNSRLCDLPSVGTGNRTHVLCTSSKCFYGATSPAFEGAAQGSQHVSFDLREGLHEGGSCRWSLLFKPLTLFMYFCVHTRTWRLQCTRGVQRAICGSPLLPPFGSQGLPRWSSLVASIFTH